MGRVQGEDKVPVVDLQQVLYSGGGQDEVE